MTWWAIVPPVLVAIVLVLVPGVVVAYAAGARGITAWGLAPALSMTGYTVLGLGYGVTHVKWNVMTVAIGIVVLTAVVAFGAWLLARRRRSERGPRDRAAVTWAAVGVLVLAFVLVSVRFAVGFGHPDSISQTYDAVFHLNGVRYILSTGDADPLTFGTLDHAFGGSGSFYPNLWHMIASIVVAGSGASIPVGVNALSIVIGALIWPLSVLLLVRQLLGPRVVTLLVAGALSASFAAFPLLLVQFGVLYPNMLGISILPASLAALIMALRFSSDAALGTVVNWVLFVVLIPGLALAHPNALISLMLIGAPLAVAFGVRWLLRARRRHASARSYILAIVVSVVVVAGCLVAFVALRPSRTAAGWAPSLGPRRALWDLVLNAQFWPPAIGITLLVALGIVAAFVSRRHRWLVGSFVLLEILYFITAYLPVGDWRYLLTGTWYSDVFRIVALIPVVFIPLSTYGVVWIGDMFAKILVRDRSGSARSTRAATRAAVAVSLVVAAVVTVGAQVGPSMTTETRATTQFYRMDSNSVLLNWAERALIERVPQEVPQNAVIAADPWTGASLVWALADRRALVPAINGRMTPDAALIMQSVNTATPGSEVCKAVRRENVRYVLDFGTDGVFGQTAKNPGVHYMRSSLAAKLVDSEGNAGLYRITACS